MRRLARRVGVGLAIILGALVIAIVATARPGDAALYPPAAGAPSIQILISHNGYHSGVLVPREAVAALAGRSGYGALIAVTTRFAAYRWIEIGRGEEAFYREVPTPGAAVLHPGVALRALFRPSNAAVLHVVGAYDPRLAFPDAHLAALDLSEPGFARLVARLDASFARDDSGLPQDLGPGLYGPSRFYRAVGTFNAVHVCTRWVADLLDAAGVPTAPVLAVMPQGLFLDLAVRSGLTALPQSRSQ
jgi:uncharacterized protein (TIGR02117 family)